MVGESDAAASSFWRCGQSLGVQGESAGGCVSALVGV